MVASITHGVARVPVRLQQQGEARRDFSLLRHGFQNVLTAMVSSGDSLELEKEFAPLLAKFIELESKLSPDLLSGPKLEARIQGELNGILERLGFNENGIVEYQGGTKHERTAK